MFAIPITMPDSIQDRLADARFMKEINHFYLKSLNKDLDDLENLEPDLSFALRGLLLAYQGSRKSFEYWDKAIELNPSADHYYNLGLCCNFLGEHAKALSNFCTALNLGKNNVGLLHLLRSAFSNLYAYDELKLIIELLIKLEKKEHTFYEEDLFTKLFNSNSQIMLEFGLGISSVISKHISFKWILHTEENIVEDRHYSINIVKCFDNNDIEHVVECNAELSEFIVDFEERHGLNLDNLYITCDAADDYA